MLSNFGGRVQFSGQIVTVKCFEDNSCVKALVATEGQGRVMVVDAGGSMRRACLGDMLAEQASANGWSGLMKTEKKGVGETQIAVCFGGVTFRPGDYLYADNNGVIVAPEELL
jgi:regulator of ribonuclease activity A